MFGPSMQTAEDGTLDNTALYLTSVTALERLQQTHTRPLTSSLIYTIEGFIFS